jgi:hypothetical protein
MDLQTNMVVETLATLVGLVREAVVGVSLEHIVAATSTTSTITSMAVAPQVPVDPSLVLLIS